MSLKHVLVFTLAAGLLVNFGLAGGGGSSSGGSSSSFFSDDSDSSSSFSFSDDSDSDSYSSGGSASVNVFGLYFAVFFMLTVAGVMVWRFVKSKKEDKVAPKQRHGELLAAATGDPIWDENFLKNYASSLFIKYQSDWSSFNVNNMATYLSPSYNQHMTLVLTALQLAGRQNVVNNVTVDSVYIEDIKDNADNSRDAFSARISFTVDDVILDTRTNNELSRKHLSGSEVYRFIRSGDSWLLDGIGQLTESATMKRRAIELFASNNGMFYSPDWGHLLLPDRGQIFTNAKYNVSDINNHTIGVYNGLLVQIYSYLPSPDQTLEYTIAQVNIPKSYGNILVRKKKGGLSGLFGRPKDMRQLQTEWGEFNEIYEVFATNLELATSFELLTPTFMEKLAAVGFDVNLEVADNVIYMYTESNSAQYDTMMSLIHNAFKEMKM